jgi:hypothetical protein
VARSDDEAAWLARRLAEYHGLGRGVRVHFADRGLLRVIDGRTDPALVCGELAAVILDSAPVGETSRSTARREQ